MIRNSNGDIVTDEDPECLGGMSLNQIVNKLIDGLQDFGEMFYNTVTRTLCQTPEDARTTREARREVREEYLSGIERQLRGSDNSMLRRQDITFNNSQKTNQEGGAIPGNTPTYNDALSNLKKAKNNLSTKLSEIQRKLSQSVRPPDYDAEQQEYKNAIELIDQMIDNIKKTRKEETKSTALSKKAKLKSKFNQSIVNKIKIAKRGNLSDNPLAQKILEWIFPATREPGGSPEKQSLDRIIDGVNRGGGWCAWIALIQEAMRCLLQGMGIEDAQKAIAKAVMKSISPVKLQILLRNLPIEISTKAIKSITDNAPQIFPEAFDNPGDGTWSATKEDGTAKEYADQLIAKLNSLKGKEPPLGLILAVEGVGKNKADQSATVVLNPASETTITLPKNKRVNALNDEIRNEVVLNIDNTNYKIINVTQMPITSSTGGPPQWADIERYGNAAGEHNLHKEFLQIAKHPNSHDG